MVSLFVIMISGAAATLIVMTALDTTVTSERYLVAQNLAEQAAEEIKNLRDTNWLAYPLFHDKCWLMIAGTTCTDSIQGTLFTTNSVYSLSNGIFESQGSPLNLSDGLGQSDNNFQVTFTGQPDPSEYYRQIAVTSADSDSIAFIVTVEWLDGAKTSRFSSDTITIENEQQ